MAKLEIVIGNEKYPQLEIPADACTIASWKELIAQGYLGTKVLYGQKLICIGPDQMALPDGTSVPSPPTPMRVSGPRSVLGMFESALRKKVGAPKPLVEYAKIQPQPKKKQGWPWLGKYHVIRTIGSGFTGPCVYEAEHIIDKKKVALKWPASRDEVSILKGIAEKFPAGRRGIPTMLGTGKYDNKPYLVMDVFRLPLQHFFPRIWSRPMDERWPVTCLLGRILLRRLEALHDCGFVHCDISPENILLGRHGRTDYDPHIIDFGLARPYPGGRELVGEHGSAEWSSIRSADGGERRFEDDLESLGWVLMNCLHSVLPWFSGLEVSYEKWGEPSVRQHAVRQVQSMKLTFLYEGWKACGEWCKQQPSPPQDLYQFIKESQKQVVPPQRPDYAHLAGLLRADPKLDAEAAEAEDLRLFHIEFPPV